MSERVTTARVRELRDAATPGPWEHEHIGYGGQEVTMDARHSVFVDGRGNAALIAAAPDLAADLLEARDDIGARDRLLDLTERRAAEVAEENARLRAIVEGRTVAPTDAELREHMDAGGAWLVTIPARRQVRLHPETRYVDDARAASLLWWTEGARWVAVRDGRPCAWPAPREPAADVARDAPGAG